MKVTEFLDIKGIKLDLKATEKQEILKELVDVFASVKDIGDKKVILKALLERESLGSTGIGQGIAIPHGKTDKVKELVLEYETLSNGKISGKTKEGVTLYLKKAYASVFHEQLLDEAVREREEKAKLDSAFSSAAISKGATTYGSQKEAVPSLSDDDKAILAKWGMSPSEWLDDYKKHGR